MGVSQGGYTSKEVLALRFDGDLSSGPHTGKRRVCSEIVEHYPAYICKGVLGKVCLYPGTFLGSYLKYLNVR